MLSPDPQTVQPGPELLYDDVSYGTESSSGNFLTENPGICGAVFLAVVWFGFLRPRWKRGSGDG